MNFANLSNFLKFNSIYLLKTLPQILSKSIGLVHKNFLIEQQAARVFKASTKTRKEVRGGGKKPWRQKGTGKARAGSTRSPLWVGGGVIFGPKPKKIKIKTNKKEKKLSLLLALFLKNNRLVILPETFFLTKTSKTKDLVNALNEKNKVSPFTKNNKILILLEKTNKNLSLASRNLKNVELSLIHQITLSKILNTSKIFCSGSVLINFLKRYE